MAETRTDFLILILMGIIILLMVSITGLFIRMNQLQSRVLAALEPFQAMRIPEGLEVGSKAPDFTLTEIEGREVSLKDFSGRKVLLVFSSVGCPACVEIFPELKEFEERNPDVQVVMVSQGTDEENRMLVEEEGFGFPILEWEDVVAREYLLPGTPFFYVIEEGVIVGKGFANTLEQLEELVREGG
jgi:methylamine dehydrogenase accessory protein MauD